MKLIHLSLLIIATATATAHGRPAFDFSVVTSLANSAVAGQNVTTPVRGFELLLLKDGQPVYDQSFGLWSIGRVAAADSATKTFSAALMMSLVDSAPQQLSLSTRLSQFIPAFGGDKAAITIAQSFSHMSGLSNSDAISDPSITLQQAALQIASPPLAFTPGTTFSYGGTSMQAAGAVGELVGGQLWDILFAQRIAGPLGLTATRYALTTPVNPRIAGGCESTAAEFARFMETLRRGGLYGNTRILTQASVDAMFTRQPPLGVPVANSPLNGSSDYGVGVWLDQRDPAGNLVGAVAAGARGFSCWIDFDDRMVGCFATDLTTSGNILSLVYLIRDAAQAAVRSGVRCPGDFNQNGATTVQDIFDFLSAYFAGDPRSDVNGLGGVSVQDLFDFLSAYFAGCS